MEEKEVLYDKYLKKLHHDILMIMDEVDRICKENKLRYYLFAGSCLGAVRHQGFIPWDDDLDVVMPRSDFNRFVEITSQKNGGTGTTVIGESFYLRWVTTERSYNQAFAKICLKDTFFQESKGDAAQNAGIFVDIFPLDTCRESGRSVEIKDRLLQSLKSVLYDKGSERNKLGWSFKLWGIRILSSFISNRAIIRMMLWIISPNGRRTNDSKVVYATPYPIRRMIVPDSWYGEGKHLHFEDRTYNCPTEAESCLARMYGDNYMQLPPENKRKTHYPIRVVFSDGEEMVFERAQNRVGYQDIID